MAENAKMLSDSQIAEFAMVTVRKILRVLNVYSNRDSELVIGENTDKTENVLCKDSAWFSVTT